MKDNPNDDKEINQERPIELRVDKLATIATIIASIGIMILITNNLSIIKESLNFSTNIQNIALLIVSGTTIFFIVSKLNESIERYSLPISHSVAIIGFPRAGKTTLITSLFGEIFARRILGVKAAPKGTSTITRLNQSLEMLNKGLFLGPTQESDRFSYRADVTIKKFPYNRTYKTEFADFPGDDSEEYIRLNGPWLHTSEFFKWTIESDAIILVVDLEQYVSPSNRQNYVAHISSVLQAAWQHFLDYNESRINEVRKHPLILTFTKADLFGIHKYPINNSLQEKIADLGFGNQIPTKKYINSEALKQGKIEVMKDFDELIKYFKSEAPNFHIIFTSSFGFLNGRRLGFNELLLAVLPP